MNKGSNANVHWVIEKARDAQKNIYFCFINYANPFTVWISTNRGKFFKSWEYQTIIPASWEACVQFKKQHLEPDMEHWTGSTLGKEYAKAV